MRENMKYYSYTLATNYLASGACPGILKAFFFCAFQFFRGGGPAQKIAEKVIFSTKKVAKYR